MILNGLVWFIIVAFSLILIDMTDTWTRKAIQFMDKADKWIRKLIDNLFEWIQKKNLKIISSIILLIVTWYSCSTRNNTQADNLI